MNDGAASPGPTKIATQGETEVRIEREFDAPRNLVWEAHTDPALLSQWLGPRRLTMTVQEMEVR
ncbi:MAG TPA: SRPBCC domain-containing protein [Solirubrobacterales bacterium]|nr:SRPBCC domain-containing protein [Solirubrobacterales bacterium]